MQTPKRPWRLSMQWLMLSVGVASLGLAALATRTPGWVGAAVLATVAVLLLAVVGAVCRTGRRRAWWLGFALFGWTYSLLFGEQEWNLFHLTDEHAAYTLPYSRFEQPIRAMIEFFGHSIVGQPIAIAGLEDTRGEELYRFSQIADLFVTLSVAVIGGALARALFGNRAGPDEPIQRNEGVDGSGPRRGRRLVIGVLAYLALGRLMLTALNLSPDFAPGAALFATWGLIALASVGAVCGSGRRRAACLAGALFGAGTLVMLSARDPHHDNWARQAADALLKTARNGMSFSRLPLDRVSAEEVRIRRALDVRVPMRYPQDTPLPVVLKDIREYLARSGHRDIPIYLDPNVMLDRPQIEHKRVVLELEGAPLRTSLNLILDQNGFKYRIVNGILQITEYDRDYVSDSTDPFLELGYCYLALVAIGMGAALGPLARGARDQTAA